MGQKSLTVGMRAPQGFLELRIGGNGTRTEQHRTLVDMTGAPVAMRTAKIEFSAEVRRPDGSVLRLSSWEVRVASATEAFVRWLPTGREISLVGDYEFRPSLTINGHAYDIPPFTLQAVQLSELKQ